MDKVNRNVIGNEDNLLVYDNDFNLLPPQNINIKYILGHIKKITCLASTHFNFSRSGGRGFLGFFFSRKMQHKILLNAGNPVYYHSQNSL